MNNERLVAMLKKKARIDEQELARLVNMHRERGGQFSDLLISEGHFTERELTLLISQELNVPMLSLAQLKIDSDVLKMIPKKISEHYGLIPVSRIGNVLTVAMSDPLNIFALDEVRDATGCTVRPILSTHQDIQRALEHYLGGAVQIDDLLEDADQREMLELIKEDDGGAKQADDEQDGGAPVIKLMTLVLSEALKRRASDIHFESYENDFRVRYRIDGSLQEFIHPPRRMCEAVMSRLKIMSELDITERRVPQDGRFRVKLNRKEIDFRLSILPMQFGEKAVLRVLDHSSVQVGLDRLGFNPKPLERFKEAITKPYGMILVTGPTGSGKSTSLYAVLNELNTPTRNIMTVEDPVEYQVEGISQTQVHPGIGLTFGSGLRSLLRQSPDVVLVGEIRDHETADIAVKAALTGHLVLSTLHTNNASGAFTRLIDMGIEPFLVASSVILVTAQRLCRKLCEHCRQPYKISKAVCDDIGVQMDDLKGSELFKPKGCSACHETGYYGRLGTMEALWVDEPIRELVLNNAPTNQIEDCARQAGMRPLFDDVFDHFKDGKTSLQEVMRITGVIADV